ncbi:Uncharacterised protein [uncultured archaeon]|nr:Uncharacterised protein [uncultured archaeon]
MARVLDALAEQEAAWQARFPDFNSPEVASRLQRTVERVQKYRLVCALLGWPPRGDVTPKEILPVVAASDAQDFEQAYQRVETLFFSRFDTEGVLRLFACWERNPWLQARLPILRQVVEAHTGGLYYLTVPAILPQLEGLLADAFGHQGRLHEKDLLGYLERLFDGTEELAFDDAVRAFYATTVLGKFTHGTPLPRALSRHAVLHGADTEYGTLAYSLKALLLFDLVQDRFGVASYAGGRCYHLPTCPVFQRERRTRRADRLVIHWLAELARKDGKRPCKRCLPE